MRLAVALGGTSYAAIKLPRNSVGTKQLQKNAVVATKLSARSVGPQKLQNNAVTTRTVKDNQLTGAKIVESTLGQVPSAKNAEASARVLARSATGSAAFTPTTNANLNNDENRGTGSAQFFRANGTGVTVLYGWREDALGAATACRVSEKRSAARGGLRFPGASVRSFLQANPVESAGRTADGARWRARETGRVDSATCHHALRLNRLPTTSSACARSGAGSRSSKQA